MPNSGQGLSAHHAGGVKPPPPVFSTGEGRTFGSTGRENIPVPRSPCLVTLKTLLSVPFPRAKLPPLQNVETSYLFSCETQDGGNAVHITTFKSQS